MKPREALKRYLFGHRPAGPVKVTSCFKAALCDSRKTTGRQINGSKISRRNHGNWLGAIGYMALLDQIGNCLKPKDKIQSNYEAGMKRALDYFSDLSKNEINALYALRCSFAHDYSLINVDKHNQEKDKHKDKLTHRFHVGISGKVVDLPAKKWDREFKNRENITYINLEGFGDLVERTCQSVIRKYQENMLELSLPVEEFVEKYFFYTAKP